MGNDADAALVSRSQGKRLVFRVWAQAHPDIQIVLRSTNEAVAAMLRRVGFVAT